MPSVGVTVVVMQGEKVLLTRREDFAVWCLPGGAVDPQEAVEQAALREVREETGLDVALTGVVGVCSRPLWTWGGTYSIVLAATPLSGTLDAQPTEVTAVDYFPRAHLPTPILWDHPTYIRAAFAGGRAWCARPTRCKTAQRSTPGATSSGCRARRRMSSCSPNSARSCSPMLSWQPPTRFCSASNH